MCGAGVLFWRTRRCEPVDWALPEAGWCVCAGEVAIQQVCGLLAVLGVDWTSLAPYKELAAGLVRTGQHAPPYVFMNYRYACAAMRSSGC